jgi:hypothetical protein
MRNFARSMECDVPFVTRRFGMGHYGFPGCGWAWNPKWYFYFFAHGSDHLSNTSTAQTRSSTRRGLRRQRETVQEPSEMITIVIRTTTGHRNTLSIRESGPISQVFERYASLSGIPVDLLRLIYAGHEVENNGRTVHEARIRDGSTIDVALKLRGGKPIIYLYPPTVMDVSVKLTLVPAWEYSALYPLTPIRKIELAKGQVGQHIEWHVHANPSGLLQDKLSGKDVTYLFWEAECVAHLAPFFRTDGPLPGPVGRFLNHSPHLVPLVPIPRPLIRPLSRAFHSTPRRLKSPRMRASSFQPIKYHPTLMMLWRCLVYTLKPGRPSSRMSSLIFLHASLFITAPPLVTGSLPS